MKHENNLLCFSACFSVSTKLQKQNSKYTLNILTKTIIQLKLMCYFYVWIFKKLNQLMKVNFILTFYCTVLKS